MLYRILLLTLALLMMAMPLASAQETRTEIIMLEGMEEEIETTYFESPRGYSFWYDPQSIIPQVWGDEDGEGNDIDTFVPANPDAASPIRLDIYFGGGLSYTLDQAARDTMDMLIENYGQAEAWDVSGMFEDGLLARGFYAPQGDGVMTDYFLVEANGGAFHIVLTYPLEAAEGYASRIRWMLRSFHPTAARGEIS